jgi:hypothetical protein
MLEDSEGGRAAAAATGADGFLARTGKVCEVLGEAIGLAFPKARLTR